MSINKIPSDKWIVIVSNPRSGTHALKYYLRDKLKIDSIGEPLHPDNIEKFKKEQLNGDKKVCVVMVNQLRDPHNLELFDELKSKAYTVKLIRNDFDVISSTVISLCDDIWLEKNTKSYDFYVNKITKKFFKFTYNRFKRDQNILRTFNTDTTLYYDDIQHILNPSNDKLKRNLVDPRIYEMLKEFYYAARAEELQAVKYDLACS